MDQAYFNSRFGPERPGSTGRAAARAVPGSDNRPTMIRYLIDASATLSHTFAVTLTVPQPATLQQLSLPAWIPGSYLIREFARHLSGITAEQGGQAVPVQQQDKATWAVTCEGEGDLVVRYRVYAFDLSVRAAFLDPSRGFFNGTSVCLRVQGREKEAHALALCGLAADWQVATTLPNRGVGENEFVASSYDELVDHPMELGRFWRGRFEALGTSHEFVVAGALPDFDGDRLLADARKLCETEIAFWHGSAGQAPFERYLFLLNAVDDGRGGLEHRSSTALVAARRDLPRRLQPRESSAETSDGYVGVLGLIAHEYFHAWNVKRLKPREFAAFDYGRENYTGLLWFFEGFTSYYDDLFVARSGLVDGARYLKLLGKTISAVAAMPGRQVQSVAAASFDAWVKYYRQDENTPNATVSYYAKGSLVALAFDLTLRSEGKGTLDASHAPALVAKRRRRYRRRRHRVGARARRRPLLCCRDGGLGPWHRRVAARGIAASFRCRARSPAGDAGAAPGPACQRRRADRRQGHPCAARWRRRESRAGRRRRDHRRRRLAIASSRRRAAQLRVGRRSFPARGPRPALAAPADRGWGARGHRNRHRSVAARRERQRRGARAV